MNRQEIISNANLLLEAIDNNNIELTEVLVDYLNNNFELLNNEFSDLTELIPLSTISHNSNRITEAFLYAINNLNCIKDSKILKWNSNIALLQNNIEKKEFALNFINSADKIENYQIPFLIQSCILMDDYELIQQIKNKL